MRSIATIWNRKCIEEKSQTCNIYKRCTISCAGQEPERQSTCIFWIIVVKQGGGAVFVATVRLGRAMTVLLAEVSQRVRPRSAALLELRGAVLNVLVVDATVLEPRAVKSLLFSW